MNFKLATILIAYGISCLNAKESNDDESDNGTIEGNLTDLYFKGLKVPEPKGFCDENICLKKCCPFGAHYIPKNMTCVNTMQIFDPQIYDNYLRPQSINASDVFYYKTGIINCKNKVRFRISDLAERTTKGFHLRSDGKLYAELPLNVPPWMLIGPEYYCIDNFLPEKDGTNISQVDALFCFNEEKDTNDYVLTAICMLVSCIFILLTVGVYIWLPQLHNVHGRILIAYLTCLFVGFIFMATMQLLLEYNMQSRRACAAMTFIIYFSLLSAFFWLNVMSYDIWRVFSGKREIRPQKLVVWKQIRSYALYAFGIPSILTILLISLEYSGLPHNPWLPMIYFHGCFISGKSKLLYLYVPILVLCVANMTLFVLTAVKIAKTRKETSVLSSRESTRHDKQNDKQTLLLYVKLFILMGISWILEIVSALYPSKNWRVSDAYNLLVGLIIFIIFVCKRQILRLIKERYREVKNSSASQSNTTWSRASTTKEETAFNSKYGQ